MRGWSMLVVLCVLAGGPALASKPALRLERIDPSGFADGGKLRVFASLVELEGQVDDGRAQELSLRIDGGRAIRPERVEPFRTAAVPLDLVLVIETSALYGVQKLTPPSSSAPAPRTKKRGQKPAPVAAPTPALAQTELPLDRVKEALAGLLESRTTKTRVLVVDYGGEVTPHPPFRPANAAQGALDELQPDDESGDVHLADAVRAGLLELNRGRSGDEGPPPRRLIVVVSDGINAQMDKKTFRALGDTAAIAGVPIHSIAFSPTDDRGPLVNLGEISKRSNGTFRWARSADELKAQIETLADELDKQYVATFALSLDTLEGHSFQLSCGELSSNQLHFSAGGSVFGYTGPVARRSLWWTVLAWVGGVVGGLFLLAVLITIVRRGRGGATAGLRLVLPDGRELALDPRVPIILGQERGTLQLADPAISGRHAQLTFDGRGWLLTDLGSTNGSWVDGQRIDRPTYLAVGNVVQVGNTRLRLLG